MYTSLCIHIFCSYAHSLLSRVLIEVQVWPWSLFWCRVLMCCNISWIFDHHVMFSRWINPSLQWLLANCAISARYSIFQLRTSALLRTPECQHRRPLGSLTSSGPCTWIVNTFGNAKLKRDILQVLEVQVELKCPPRQIEILGLLMMQIFQWLEYPKWARFQNNPRNLGHLEAFPEALMMSASFSLPGTPFGGLPMSWPRYSHVFQEFHFGANTCSANAAPRM